MQRHFIVFLQFLKWSNGLDILICLFWLDLVEFDLTEIFTWSKPKNSLQAIKDTFIKFIAFNKLQFFYFVDIDQLFLALFKSILDSLMLGNGSFSSCKLFQQYGTLCRRMWRRIAHKILCCTSINCSYSFSHFLN